MRLRAVIIDDEETGIDILKFQIQKYIPEIKVVGQALRAIDAIGLIGDFMPEIVFLDINMPQMDGFELLNHLEWKDFNLVFTTAHHQHALRALKLSAKDYLLKPVDQVDLRNTTDRIIKQIAEEREPKIDYSLLNGVNLYYASKLAINTRNGIENVNLGDILILESNSNYTKVYLEDSRLLISPKTLREFELQLCQQDLKFMRVHHSFVVNLHKVKRYTKEEEKITMSNNLEVPLARSKKESFCRWLAI